MNKTRVSKFAMLIFVLLGLSACFEKNNNSAALEQNRESGGNSYTGGQSTGDSSTGTEYGAATSTTGSGSSNSQMLSTSGPKEPSIKIGPYHSCVVDLEGTKCWLGGFDLPHDRTSKYNKMRMTFLEQAGTSLCSILEDSYIHCDKPGYRKNDDVGTYYGIYDPKFVVHYDEDLSGKHKFKNVKDFAFSLDSFCII